MPLPSDNRPLVIYIASPYTLGDVAANVAVQKDAAHRILDLGHCPIAPLLSHYLHIHKQRPYEDWLQMDLVLIRKCDALLRLPGESRGADIEANLARAMPIPVFLGWDDFYQAMLGYSQNAEART